MQDPAVTTDYHTGTGEVNDLGHDHLGLWLCQG